MDLLWGNARILRGSLDCQGEKEGQTAVEPAPKIGAHGGGWGAESDAGMAPVLGPTEDGEWRDARQGRPCLSVGQGVRGGGRLND